MVAAITKPKYLKSAQIIWNPNKKVSILFQPFENQTPFDIWKYSTIQNVVVIIQILEYLNGPFDLALDQNLNRIWEPSGIWTESWTSKIC